MARVLPVGLSYRKRMPHMKQMILKFIKECSPVIILSSDKKQMYHYPVALKNNVIFRENFCDDASNLCLHDRT